MRGPSLAELPPPPAGRHGWPWTEESKAFLNTRPDGSPWPLVSIVTPSYNQAPFLEETIRSVLLQGYPSLEYIIIDGGSTDGSVEIIRKYEPWLAYWGSEKDKGQSEAINKGWRRSHGEILAWLNSDDCYTTGAFAEAMSYLSHHPETALIYTDCIIIDEGSQPKQVIRVADFDLRAEIRENVIPQQTTFIRREAVEQVGLLDERLHFVMDYDLWIKIGRRYKVERVSGLWASFRMCAGTKSVSQTEAFFGENLAIIQLHLSDKEFASSIGLSLNQARSSVHLVTGLSCYEMFKLRAARRHFVRAVRWDPRALAHPLLLRCLFKSFFGERFISGVRNRRRLAGVANSGLSPTGKSHA